MDEPSLAARTKIPLPLSFTLAHPAPAPAQRLGERPVVLGQGRHSPAELCDLLLQGFDLLLQGLDLRGVLLLRLLVLRGQRPQGGVAVA